jgi:hypothetical protein
MSGEPEQMRLINTSTRPVELHLPSGVVVIGAQGETTCSAADLESPQVKVLSQRGVLMARPLQPPSDSAPAPERRSGRSGRGRRPR